MSEGSKPGQNMDFILAKKSLEGCKQQSDMVLCAAFWMGLQAGERRGSERVRVLEG